MASVASLVLASSFVGVASLINGSFEMLGALRSKGLPGFSLCVADGRGACAGASATTNASGIATLEMEQDSDFVVLARNPPGYQDLWIVGSTGSSSFRYPTYMGTRLESQTLATLMRRPCNTSLGGVVVGMDVRVGDRDLEPAVGASALVRGIAGPDPFILDHGFLPRSGQTVTKTGSSFVTWTNMEVNTAGTVEVVPPEGMSCLVSPGLRSRTAALSVRPDSVMVVSYICGRTTGAVFV